MATLIQWWNMAKAKLMSYKVLEEEDFEILDFDHILISMRIGVKTKSKNHTPFSFTKI